MRLKSVLKLQPAKLLSLLFLEAARWLYGETTTFTTLGKDLFYYVLFAVAVPLTLHVIQEVCLLSS